MTETTASSVFEQFAENFKRTTEMGVQAQQDLFKQWSGYWSKMPGTQPDWVIRTRQFQQEWASTLTSILEKHREDLDRQYQNNIRLLTEALRAAGATDGDEFRKRAELLFRQSLDSMKEMSDTQMRLMQESITKWMELTSKVGTPA